MNGEEAEYSTYLQVKSHFILYNSRLRIWRTNFLLIPSVNFTITRVKKLIFLKR